MPDARHPALWIRHGDTANVAASYPMLTVAPAIATDGVPVPPDNRDSFANLDITWEGGAVNDFTVTVWGFKSAAAILIAGVITAIAGVRGPGWTQLAIFSVSGNGVAQQREAHQLQGISSFSRLALQFTAGAGAPVGWGDLGFSPHKEAA